MKIIKKIKLFPYNIWENLELIRDKNVFVKGQTKGVEYDYKIQSDVVPDDIIKLGRVQK